MSNNRLIEYLRKRDRSPYGALVAVKNDDNTVAVGFSMCNLKQDKYSRNTALIIATARARNKADKNRLPRSIAKQMEAFNARVLRYFKIGDIQLISTWHNPDAVKYIPK